jgi:hypothetical protein
LTHWKYGKGTHLEPEASWKPAAGLDVLVTSEGVVFNNVVEIEVAVELDEVCDLVSPVLVNVRLV